MFVYELKRYVKDLNTEVQWIIYLIFCIILSRLTERRLEFPFMALLISGTNFDCP